MLQRNGYFCAFSVDMLWGKSDSSYLLSASLGFEAIDCEDWWREEDAYQSTVYIKSLQISQFFLISSFY